MRRLDVLVTFFRFLLRSFRFFLVVFGVEVL